MAVSDDSRPPVPIDPQFVTLAQEWMQNPAEQLVGLIWSGYDRMRTDNPSIDERDLERSITQLLEPRIRAFMTGYEPFYIQHGPFERETMMSPPAQPPQYDLAFVLRADERLMWPIEAKVLETPKAVAAYIEDINEQFLKCRYAPFFSSGAMLGYLLEGKSEQAFAVIAAKLSCLLAPVFEPFARNSRVSKHVRTVPHGKNYPAAFACYHLILEYLGVRRASAGHRPKPRRAKSREP